MSPMGMATSIAIPVAISVPVTKGKIPNSAFGPKGCSVVPVKKLINETSLKNSIVSNNKVNIIPNVVNTDIIEITKRILGIIFSKIFENVAFLRFFSIQFLTEKFSLPLSSTFSKATNPFF